MKSLTLSMLLLISCSAVSAQNPHPLLNQPLVPVSTAPGSAGFTLMVSGTGFVSGAVLDWNGSPRPTTFLSSSSLQASISSTDVAHVGTASVTVVNPSPGGGVSNAVYFPIRQPAASVAFAPEAGVSPATGVTVAGDFNHDGKLDLAVGQVNSDGQTGTILLYRGMGDGTFAAPVITASSLGITSLQTGDFNNDGKLDLLVGTIPNGAFGPVQGIVFLGDNAGHFQEKTPFGGGDAGGPIGIADLNGDGILDVLFEGQVQGSGTIQVFLGNGDGTFTLKSNLNLNSVGSNAGIGDFNRDGKLDLAVPESGQVDIFIGNGDGTYQPLVPYACYPCAGGVTAADFNGDGKLDLAVGELTVLLGNGDGTFTLGAQYSNGAGNNAIGDFNGDGKLDVVTAGSVVSAYLGNGDGTFQNVITTGNFAGNNNSNTFADFNRDGQLDVTVSGASSVQIGLQTSLGVSPNSLSYGSHKVGTASKPQTVSVTNVSSHAVPVSSIAITGTNAGDFVEQNNCGPGIKPGITCQVKVVFKPLTAGSKSAAVSITYTGLDTPQTVSLSGFGFN